MPIPQQLVDAVRSNRAIAFVGSGFSFPAGAPSWKEILYGLIAAADALNEPATGPKLAAALKATLEGRLINAATIVSGVLPVHEMQYAIVDGITHRQNVSPCNDQSLLAALRGERINTPLIEKSGPRTDRRLTATRSHEILLQLNLRAIITTNYDHLFEDALGRQRVTSYSHGSFASAPRIPPGRQFILHLHGDIDHPGDIVVSWGDYDGLLSTAALESVQALLRTSTTLWIGYSHSDPDVMLALAQNHLFPLAGGFQVVKESDYELGAMCKARNITPIWVDSYESVPSFLEELAAETGAELPALLPRRASSPATAGVAALNAVGRAITNCFLADPLARLPQDLVDPRIRQQKQEKRLDSE